MNPKIVGKCAQEIAKMAGISIPSDVEILVGSDQKIGKDHPYSREKLCPILAFFTVDTWEEACELAIRLLQNEGTGHTMVIHSNDESIVREFALKKPVSRFLVNSLGSLGGVGATTGLMPALTLGCGAIGGSATSDNVGPMNLLNIRHVAYGLTELEDVRALAPSVDFGSAPCAPAYTKPAAVGSGSDITASDIERITREVLRSLQLG
jgi:acyl-CoA reductase-like NAD-dependent aldehyde dehydrogenase